MAADLVLLTGATGMIGFRTLVLLLQAGYHVRAAIRDESRFAREKALRLANASSSQLETTIVPDITAPGAYDKAVEGVTYVVHIASPLAHPKFANADFEAEVVQPAVRGTVGLLESAARTTGIKRVVITASVVSLVTFLDLASGDIVNETHPLPIAQGPYSNLIEAYGASKARAYKASIDWMSENHPAFDLVNIMPTFVIGRDETVTDPKDITKGTNGYVMGPILGASNPNPVTGTTVHVDDVARMHVQALDPAIQGNQDYLAASDSPEGIEWADSFDILKKNYPKECAEGIFKVNGTQRPLTVKARVDSSKAAKAFGFEFKSYEEQVLSVAGHYLELIGRKA